MVLSNTKLKRKKREEAAAVAVLNPPPDTNATSSSANVANGDSSSVLSLKNKSKSKRKKLKAVNGDAKDSTSGTVPESIRDTNSLAGEGNVLDVMPVQMSKKRRQTDPEVGMAHETPVGVKDAGKTFDSGDCARNCVESSSDVGALESESVQEEAFKKKNRKKPRWKLDENGKKVKPQKVGGEGEGPSNGAVAVSCSDKGTKIGDVFNGSLEKDGGVAVAEAVNDGDRIHQGYEPWLQSKRSKKKKKLTDRWGKKLNNAEAAEAAGDDPTAGDENQEASQVALSTEDKVDPKKVLVGGMPYYISEDDIHEYFHECGSIAELDCVTFSDTGKFRGLAFITFRTEEAAKRALALDGADMGGRFLKIEICKIRPRETTKKEAYREPPKKFLGCLSAYIGNLSWDVTEKELRKCFKGCKIDSIRFAENRETGEFRGFGHVDFTDDESLEAAMKLDQMMVLGRPLKIAYSVPPNFKHGDGSGGQPGDRKKGCFKCGEEGHMSYNCPK